jgi:hypothetical protein
LLSRLAYNRIPRCPSIVSDNFKILNMYKLSPKILKNYSPRESNYLLHILQLLKMGRMIFTLSSITF